MKKLIATFRKKGKKLNQNNVHQVMRIIYYNDSKYYQFLEELYRVGGRAIVKEFKKELGISSSAYYGREWHLKQIDLVQVVPREESEFWTREVKLNSLVHKWFKGEI